MAMPRPVTSGHNRVRQARALAAPALNIRASHERLPWASFRDKQVLTMRGWDLTSSEGPSVRDAARARTAAARAAATSYRVLPPMKAGRR